MKTKRVLRSLTICIPAVLVLLSAGTAAEPKRSEAPEYAIVVHEKNGYSDKPTKMRAMVRDLFLKEKVKWPGGTKAKPLGRSEPDVSQAFSTEVLGMSESQLAKHWIKVKQKTGTTPPRDVGRTKSLLKMIGKSEGAFSCVLLDEVTPVPKGVKVLFSFKVSEKKDLHDSTVLTGSR